MAERIDVGNAHIGVEIAGFTGTVSLNRPDRHNAIDTAMWRAIPKAVAALEARDIRVILLRGIGARAFSAGADIAEFEATRGTPDASRAYDALSEAAYGALRDTQVPTVALIHGFCLGGGLALATSCDIRIASARSQYAIPAGRLGLAYPHDSLAHLTRITGPALAKQLLFTAGRIDAAQALAAGLVNEVAAADELDARGDELCAQIAANAPLTLRAAKYVIDASARNPAVADMGAISAHANACFESADYAEGRKAFMEKRNPIFSGN